MFELSQTSEVQEIPVKKTLFRTTQRLSLFFVENFRPRALDGDDDSDVDSDSGEDNDSDGGSEDRHVTRLSYLGFKGEWMALGRAPAQILYEAAPNPNDHKLTSAVKDARFNSLGG